MTKLPYITPLDLLTGGVIKDEPSHFIVEEVPMYLPEGSGQHIYLLIRKTNLNTSDVEKSLMETLSISDKDIGHAGMKDKRAITTQWFSLSLGASADINEVCSKITEKIKDIEILEASKHINKLKTGHLIANKFTITISQVNENALTIAKQIIEQINSIGLPNFYGAQRFGARGDNAVIGKEIILGNKRVKKHWLKKMFISAYQSGLFNSWLINRIEDDLFDELIDGDLLQKVDGGRSFPLDQEKEHKKEFINKEISYTGPIFGSKVSPPKGLEKEREDEIFDKEDITLDQLKAMNLKGTRRNAKVFPENLSVIEGTDSITLSFTLPSGSYATILLREFTKNF